MKSMFSSCDLCPLSAFFMALLIIIFKLLPKKTILCRFKKDPGLLDLPAVDQDQGQLHGGIGCKVPGGDNHTV